MRSIVRVPELDVPANWQRSEQKVADLAQWLDGRRFVAVTGAGCSTESGIPDYRGSQTGRRKRNPIKHQEFVASAHVRKRYWSRSVVGWRRIHGATPNGAHRALAGLERRGLCAGVVTQNVDRLHQTAGSHHVVELHGALAEVRCLKCGNVEARQALQTRLEAANPDWESRWPAVFAPDGDADLQDAPLDEFVVPSCIECHGVLMPNVVFFGGQVNPQVSEDADQLCRSADAILVIGSSLAVWSSYRLARGTVKSGGSLAIVNMGPTRADDLADVRVHGRASQVLSELLGLL